MDQLRKNYVPVNNIEIYYEISGTGTPIFFVHAGISSSRMWEPQFDEFSKKYTVIRYDMRGFGRTKPVSGSFNHTEDLYQLLKTLKIDKAHFIGCSKGGGTCFDLAVTHPEMVLSLTMVASLPNGFKYSWETTAPPEWDECVKAFEAGDLKLTAELEAKIWVTGRYRTNNDVSQELFEEIVEDDLIALTNEKETQMKEQPIVPLAMEQLENLQCPLMFIYGDKDDPDLVKANKLLLKELRAKEYIIENTAHFPSREKPDEFNKVLLDFLRNFY